MSLRFSGTIATALALMLYVPVASLLWPFLALPLDRLALILSQSPQFWVALQVTLVTTIGSLALALTLSLIFVGSLVFTPAYDRFVRQLPWLLAIPHLAFAVGLYVLFGPNGWFERLVEILRLGSISWPLVQDRWGISLALTLGVKESWFLCWVLWVQLQRAQLVDQYLVAQTLGYRRPQIIWAVLLPQLLPALRWPLMAVAAFSLSSVEMAWVIGPTHPPSLAVLAWRALLDPIEQQRELGLVMALILIGLMLVLAALIWVLPSLLRGHSPNGKRWRWSRLPGKPLFSGLVAVQIIAAMLLLIWSFTHSWFYPDLLPQRWSLNAWRSLSLGPLFNALTLGVVSTLLSVGIVLLLIERIRRRTGWLLLPLFLPVLPLVISQYQWLHYTGMPLGWGTVMLSHVLWVIPYVYLVLKPAHQHLNPDLLLVGKSLGMAPAALFFKIKLPLMTKAIAAAFALGFSVSLVQYLPTVFNGAGRVDTLTTETLTLYSGGNKRLLGAQTLVLLVTGLLIYLLALKVPDWFYRKQRGMH